MQKLAWEISWESADHLQRRSLDEDTVKNQIVGDQTESLWSEINEYKVERQTLKRS